MPKIHSFFQEDITRCGFIHILNVQFYTLISDRFVSILFLVERCYTSDFVTIDALLPSHVKHSFGFQITHLGAVQVILIKARNLALFGFLQDGCGRNWFRSAV
jgi:hypothetical protein